MVLLYIFLESGIVHFLGYGIVVKIEYSAQKEQHYGVHPPQAELERVLLITVGAVIYGRDWHDGFLRSCY